MYLARYIDRSAFQYWVLTANAYRSSIDIFFPKLCSLMSISQRFCVVFLFLVPLSIYLLGSFCFGIRRSFHLVTVNLHFCFLLTERSLDSLILFPALFLIPVYIFPMVSTASFSFSITTHTNFTAIYTFRFSCFNTIIKNFFSLKTKHFFYT